MNKCTSSTFICNCCMILIHLLLYFFIVVEIFLKDTLFPPLSSELPVIEPHPSILDVILNNPITLPCRATGSPRPTITWQKEGINIPNTGNKSHMCVSASENNHL